MVEKMNENKEKRAKKKERRQRGKKQSPQTKIERELRTLPPF